MKRPSRSFTVEVKRSRSRTGDGAGADSKGKPGREAAATVSEALSWGDLIDRVSKEIAAKTERPDKDVLPSGVNHPPAAPTEVTTRGTTQAGSDGRPDPGTGKTGADPDAARSRVLPSLLPLDMPLSERKSSVYSRAADSRASPRSRLPKANPRRTGAPSTELARASGEPPAAEAKTQPSGWPQPDSPASGAFDAAQIRAVVEEHLRRRASAEDLPLAPPVAEQEPAQPEIEVDARPIGRRRREDFWKRRLRSYAARD